MGRATSAGIGFGCIALSAALLVPYHWSRVSAGTNTQEDVWHVGVWGVLLLASATRFVLAIRRSRSD